MFFHAYDLTHNYVPSISLDSIPHTLPLHPSQLPNNALFIYLFMFWLPIPNPPVFVYED